MVPRSDIHFHTLKIDLNPKGSFGGIAELEISQTDFMATTNSRINSRRSLLAEMSKLGVNTDALSSLTVDQLSDLLLGMNRLASQQKASLFAKKDTLQKSSIVLSQIDKKLLRELIKTKDVVSMVSLSKSLQVPLTTLVRRRKRIEDLLVRNVSPNYQKLGLKQVTFLLSTEAHSSASISTQILSLAGIIRTERTLSNAVDLRVEAIARTAKDIADLAEKIKMVPGVRTVSWFESLGVMGENDENKFSIIDSE